MRTLRIRRTVPRRTRRRAGRIRSRVARPGTLGRFVSGRAHAQRLQQPRPYDVAILLSRDVRDDAPEDRVPEVRVLELGAGHQRERLAALQERGEPSQIEVLLAIAPGVVAREPRRHRQEVPQGDRPALRDARGAVPAARGRASAAGSSRRRCPSSRRRSTVAAVKLLVIDAMRKTVSAVGSRLVPPTAVPTPRVWTSSPSTMTPYATPGTGSSATNPSTSRPPPPARRRSSRRTIAARDARRCESELTRDRSSALRDDGIDLRGRLFEPPCRSVIWPVCHWSRNFWKMSTSSLPTSVVPL